MRFIGKLIGALAGLRFGPSAVVVGIAIGHLFDSGVFRAKISLGANVMGSTLFQLIGHIARSDGEVSAREVALTEQIFDQFGLEGPARSAAVAQVNAGRMDGFQPQPVLKRFVDQFGLRSAQAEQMLAALIAIAYADGGLIGGERAALKVIAVALGFRDDEFIRELERFAPPAASITEDSIESCYATLGLEPGADAAAVKLAYRKRISQYHPDKLEGAGIRGDALKGAQAKAKSVRAAYERLSKI
jgi:DnaJ like chaperone protein